MLQTRVPMQTFCGLVAVPAARAACSAQKRQKWLLHQHISCSVACHAGDATSEVVQLFRDASGAAAMEEGARSSEQKLASACCGGGKNAGFSTQQLLQELEESGKSKTQIANISREDIAEAFDSRPRYSEESEERFLDVAELLKGTPSDLVFEDLEDSLL